MQPTHDPVSSPHAWESSEVDVLGHQLLRLFPTHVGIFRIPERGENPSGALPHTRGVSLGKLHPKAKGAFRLPPI